MENEKNFNIRTSDPSIYPVMPCIFDLGEEYEKIGPVSLSIYEIKNFVLRTNSAAKDAGFKNGIAACVKCGFDESGVPMCVVSFESIPLPEDAKEL